MADAILAGLQKRLVELEVEAGRIRAAIAAYTGAPGAEGAPRRRGRRAKSVAAPAAGRTVKQRKCKICGRKGHNSRTCPQKAGAPSSAKKPRTNGAAKKKQAESPTA